MKARLALAPRRGRGGPALSPAAAAAAAPSSDPASLAPPESPLFVEATVQPAGRAEVERRIAGQEHRRDRRPRRPDRLQARKLGRSIGRTSSTSTRKSSPGWAKRRASSSSATTATTSPATGSRCRPPTPAPPQEFIDKQAKAGDEPVKDGSYEGVDYKVQSSTTAPRSGSSGTSSSSPKTNSAFKDAVDASKGESLADAGRLLRTPIDAAPERQPRRRLRRHRRPDQQAGGSDRPAGAAGPRSPPAIEPDRSDRPGQRRARLRPGRDRRQQRPRRREPPQRRRLRAARLAARPTPSPPSPRPTSASSFEEAIDSLDADGIPGKIAAAPAEERPEAARASTSKRSPPRSETPASSPTATARAASAAPWC